MNMSLQLRCVLVDSELKAAARATRGLEPLLRVGNIVLDRPGRGSFALAAADATTSLRNAPPRPAAGFTLARPEAPTTVPPTTAWELSDASLLGRAARAVRAETARCPGLCGVVLMHSLAGGTGSAGAAVLARAMRLHLPHVLLLDVAVAPMPGESPLQSFNAVLGLAALYDHVDAVVLLDNGAAMAAVQAVQARVSMGDVNVHLARSLAAVLVPASVAKGAAARGRTSLWEVCGLAVPPCKLLELHSVPAPRSTAHTLLDHVQAVLKMARDGGTVGMWP